MKQKRPNLLKTLRLPGKPAMLWLLAIVIILLGHTLVALRWTAVDAFLFQLFSTSGQAFSILLILIFLIGWYILADRLLFWVLYDFLSNRFDPLESTQSNFYAGLERDARQFLQERDAISEDLEGRLKQRVRDRTLDGQDLHGGGTALQILGVLAPTIGFMGTLTGLIGSFRELGAGADLSSVLGGLGIAMSTSLIGAALYVIFTAGQTLNDAMANAVENRIDSILSGLEAGRSGIKPQA